MPLRWKLLVTVSNDIYPLFSSEDFQLETVLPKERLHFLAFLAARYDHVTHSSQLEVMWANF